MSEDVPTNHSRQVIAMRWAGSLALDRPPEGISEIRKSSVVSQPWFGKELKPQAQGLLIVHIAGKI